MAGTFKELLQGAVALGLGVKAGEWQHKLEQRRITEEEKRRREWQDYLWAGQRGLAEQRHQDVLGEIATRAKTQEALKAAPGPPPQLPAGAELTYLNKRIDDLQRRYWASGDPALKADLTALLARRDAAAAETFGWETTPSTLPAITPMMQTPQARGTRSKMLGIRFPQTAWIERLMSQTPEAPAMAAAMPIAGAMMAEPWTWRGKEPKQLPWFGGPTPELQATIPPAPQRPAPEAPLDYWEDYYRREADYRKLLESPAFDPTAAILQGLTEWWADPGTGTAQRHEFVWQRFGVGPNDARRKDPAWQAGVRAAGRASTIGRIGDEFQQGKGNYEQQQRLLRGERRADIRLAQTLARSAGGGRTRTAGGGGGGGGGGLPWTAQRSLALRGVTVEGMSPEWATLAKQYAPSAPGKPKLKAPTQTELNRAHDTFAQYRTWRAQKIPVTTQEWRAMVNAAKVFLRNDKGLPFGISPNVGGPEGQLNWLQQARKELGIPLWRPAQEEWTTFSPSGETTLHVQSPQRKKSTATPTASPVTSLDRARAQMQKKYGKK